MNKPKEKLHNALLDENYCVGDVIEHSSSKNHYLLIEKKQDSTEDLLDPFKTTPGWVAVFVGSDGVKKTKSIFKPRLFELVWIGDISLHFYNKIS